MCNCIETVNAKLAPEHRLDATLAIMPGQVAKPLIGLRRCDRGSLETRRNKPSFMVPTFCPFCGEKYPERSNG